MSDDTAVSPAENNVATPAEKRSRTSMVSRATAEGEALLKEMGFEDKETPGRRRTRAAIRGEVYTPPAKKERKASTGGARRGRPPKKTEDKKEKAAAKEEKEEEKKEEEEEEKEPSAAEDSADGEADETKSD